MACDGCDEMRAAGLAEEYGKLSDPELRSILNGSPNKKKRRAARLELERRGITINYHASRRTNR